MRKAVADKVPEADVEGVKVAVPDAKAVAADRVTVELAVDDCDDDVDSEAMAVELPNGVSEDVVAAEGVSERVEYADPEGELEADTDAGAVTETVAVALAVAVAFAEVVTDGEAVCVGDTDEEVDLEEEALDEAEAPPDPEAVDDPEPVEDAVPVAEAVAVREVVAVPEAPLVVEDDGDDDAVAEELKVALTDADIEGVGTAVRVPD